MATVRELITKWGFDVDLAAIDRFDNRIGNLRKKVDGVGRNIQAVATQARDVGARMSLALTAPIVGLGFLTLRAAGNFEAGMNRVDALAKITTVSLQQLEDQARSLGETTKFSATEAADAMGFMAQAGLDSQQIFNAMPDALNLAAAANLGLAETADLVTNVMAGMGIQSDKLGIAVDVLAKTFISSNTDLSQLGQAMKFAGPVAKGFGLDIQETTAILGLMGNAGIQASLAGTSLRGALTRLADPSAEAAKILGSLKVATDDGAGGVRNLVDIMFDLEKAGATTTQIMQVFGLRAGPAMEVLISQGNESVRDFIKELRKAGGTAKEIAEKQMRGLFGAFKELRSGVESLFIAIGKSGLLKAFTGMIKSITKFIRILARANPNLLQLSVILLGLIATIGPLIFILGTATLAFRALAIAAGFANVSLLTIPIAIIAILAALALIVEDIVVFNRGGDSLIGLFLKTFPAVGTAFKDVGAFAVRFLRNFMEIFSLLKNGVNVFIDLVKFAGSFVAMLVRGEVSMVNFAKTFENIIGGSIDRVNKKLNFARQALSDFLFETLGPEFALRAAKKSTPFVSGRLGTGVQVPRPITDLTRPTNGSPIGAGAGAGAQRINVSVTAPVSVNLPEGTPQDQAQIIVEQISEMMQRTMLGIQTDEPVLD